MWARTYLFLFAEGLWYPQGGLGEVLLPGDAVSCVGEELSSRATENWLVLSMVSSKRKQI